MWWNSSIAIQNPKGWCHQGVAFNISASLEDQQWPQDWKRSILIPVPKKGSTKEYANRWTIALISHANGSVHLLSHLQPFATPWTAARQAFLFISNSQSLLKLMSIESVMPSNHLIVCHPLLLPPSIFSSIRVFSTESVLCIRRPKYWSVSTVLPINIQGWSPLGLIGLISLQFKGLPRVFSSTTVQKHQLFCAQLSLYSNSHIYKWLLKKLV